MTAKVLCRYHMNGCCRYGQACHFSHDMHDMPSMVCTYYLAGNCAYGAQCRYDHIRPRRTDQEDDAPSISDSRSESVQAASASRQPGAANSAGRADAAWGEASYPGGRTLRDQKIPDRAHASAEAAGHHLQRLRLDSPAISNGPGASRAPPQHPLQSHTLPRSASSYYQQHQQQQQQQQQQQHGSEAYAQSSRHDHHDGVNHQQHPASHLSDRQAEHTLQQYQDAQRPANARHHDPDQRQGHAQYGPTQQDYGAAYPDEDWADPEYLEAGYESHEYYGDNTHQYGTYYGDEEAGWDSDTECDGPHMGTGQWHAPTTSLHHLAEGGSRHADFAASNGSQHGNAVGSVGQHQGEQHWSASQGASTSQANEDSLAWAGQQDWAAHGGQEDEDESGWYEDENGTWKYWPGEHDEAGRAEQPHLHIPQGNGSVQHQPQRSCAQPAGHANGDSTHALPHSPHQISAASGRSSLNGHSNSLDRQHQANGHGSSVARADESHDGSVSSSANIQRAAVPRSPSHRASESLGRRSSAGVPRAAQQFTIMQPASSAGSGREDGSGGRHEAWTSGAAAGGALQGTAPAGHQQGPHAAGYLRKLQELGLCLSYAATGACPKGEACKLVHGLACPICQKHSLHPYNEGAQAAHLQECHARHERLAARARSAVKECGICLERVLDKEVPGQRRFGLLSGCSHAFCLTCIRGWRGHVDGGADVDNALRTCPVCRTTSYFVTPSPVWPADDADKARIVGEYKAKLSTIDCRHWNFGENTCPFGTSCFYRHVYRDGRPQETTIRRYGNSDGEVKVVQPVNLASFLDLPQAQRAMHAHLDFAA